MTPNLICAIVFVCLAFIFIIAEVCTIELVSIWFVVGSLVAFILARIPQVPYYVSIIAFFVVSLVMLFSIRPIAKKFAPHRRKFNSEGRIGKEYILKKAIEPNKLGEVKIGDVIYNAKSIDNKPIEEGKEIVIKAIEGNTLVVETKKEN
ncbi:MAG: NfeD family protein [Mollicutes bacterium]|nr:NfeD family protein [Mollicutes bacterium]MDD7037460.1 NfeD family protein [Mollicutes bacterium]MDY3209670.1 NfeD family protein [Candidatus Enterosoma sp.]MDY4643709.1 NfeD family protein [Candidatus Enterosoma sp.]MDY4782586.1 NfeD family protein [Candidatus Enterosoma sp.]